MIKGVLVRCDLAERWLNDNIIIIEYYSAHIFPFCYSLHFPYHRYAEILLEVYNYIIILIGFCQGEGMGVKNLL